MHDPATPLPTETPELVRRRARGAGALAAAVALAFLWVLSGFFEAVAFPPTVLAEAFLKLTPGDIATFFIEHLGHWAMRLLVIAAIALTLVVGAEAFARSTRDSLRDPTRSAGLLFIVAAASLPLAPANTNIAGSLLVAFAAAALYAYVAGSLEHRLGDHADGADGPADDGMRRRVLQVGIGGALALTAGGGALGWLARRLGGPNTDVSLVTPAARASIPTRPSWPDIPGLTPEITAVADHYVVDVDILSPSVEADSWSLRVKGLVDMPLKIGFTGLQERFDVVEEYSVLTCVSNEVGGNLIGHSAWGGVRLTDILDAVGARPNAVDVVFRAADGYSDSIPIEVARNEHVLLAVSQNGRPLTQDHGFPCRVRVPEIYGMKNVKWLESIEIVGADYAGYWQQRGWSDLAEIQTESRIDVAGDSFRATAGDATWVAGIAWAGIRGITRVEVSTDGAHTWTEAMLRDPIGPLSWRQWAFRWTPPKSGTYLLACRATDGEGKVQTARLAPPHPSGATGYDEATVDVA